MMSLITYVWAILFSHEIIWRSQKEKKNNRIRLEHSNGWIFADRLLNTAISLSLFLDRRIDWVGYFLTTTKMCCTWNSVTSRNNSTRKNELLLQSEKYYEHMETFRQRFNDCLKNVHRLLNEINLHPSEKLLNQFYSILLQPYRTTPLILPGAKVKKEFVPNECYLRHHPNPSMRGRAPHVDENFLRQKVNELNLTCYSLFSSFKWGESQ